MHLALPADHDDDDGRDAGRVAAGLGEWRGFGTASATGYYDCRRTDCEPDADIVHHARRICLSRPLEAGTARGSRSCSATDRAARAATAEPRALKALSIDRWLEPLRPGAEVVQPDWRHIASQSQLRPGLRKNRLSRMIESTRNTA